MVRPKQAEMKNLSLAVCTWVTWGHVDCSRRSLDVRRDDVPLAATTGMLEIAAELERVVNSTL